MGAGSAGKKRQRSTAPEERERQVRQAARAAVDHAVAETEAEEEVERQRAERDASYRDALGVSKDGDLPSELGMGTAGGSRGGTGSHRVRRD